MPTGKDRRHHLADSFMREAKLFNLSEVHTAAAPETKAAFWSKIRDQDHGAAERFPGEGDPIQAELIRGGIFHGVQRSAIQAEQFEMKKQFDLDRLESKLDNPNQAILLFIPAPKALNGPNINFPLFSALGQFLNALPQLLTFSFQKRTSAMRELWNADFVGQVTHPPHTNTTALGTDTDVVSICFSLLHCKVKDTTHHTRAASSVRRTVVYLQISASQLENERILMLVSVLIGRHGLRTLQKQYFDTGIRIHDEISGRPVDLRYTHAAFLGRIATDGWQSTLDLIENDMDQIISRFSPAVDVDSDSISLLNDLYSIETRVNTITAQMKTNAQVLHGLAHWASRHSIAEEHMHFYISEFTNAAVKLQGLISRAEDVTRNLSSAMRQAERVTKFAHSAKAETILWHSLKMNYTVETLINRTTFLLVIFLPGIFTSAFFSSNFFFVTQDLGFDAANIWLWFVVTIPLGVLTLVAIYLLHLWHTNGWGKLKDYFSDHLDHQRQPERNLAV